MELGSAAPAPRWERPVRAALFIAWALAAAFLASRHVFWRDEVRALSIALSGDTFAEMLANLQGESHPAGWYLLLRAAYSLVPVREVLPVVAGVIGVAAMALLAFRSPFRPLVVGLMLFGCFALFEYVVMARNYGISVLLMFVIADRYPHWRDRGIGVGILLAMLCNTNVHSMFLAAGFLIFWLADITGEEGLRWTRKHRMFFINAAIAAIGAAASLVTVYPTVHDAIPFPSVHDFSVPYMLAIISPGHAFTTIAPELLTDLETGRFLLSLVLIGPLLAFVRKPGVVISGLFALIVFNLFFRFIYRGGYRHEALYLVYMIAIYWLALRGHGGRWLSGWLPDIWAKRLAAVGKGLFLLLLGFQIVRSASIASGTINGIPNSRVRDLAELIVRHDLSSAIVIGDPEAFLEPLPYYAPNPIYLLRTQEFSKVGRLTRRARLRLGLDEIVADARRLHAASGRPIVIVLGHRLNPNRPQVEITHSFAQRFWTSPESVRRFNDATIKLASFGPSYIGETYDVYVLRSSVGSRTVAPARRNSAGLTVGGQDRLPANGS